MHKNIYLTSQIELSASGEDFLPTQFNGVAYSGDKVFGNIVIDLSSTQIEPSLPLLFQHDHNSIIGTINSIQNNGESIIDSGILFSDIDNHAASIANKSKRGINYQQSIGLFDFDITEITEGEVIINHRNFNAPISVLKNGIIREVSIVALGADRKTNAAFFAENFNKFNEINQMSEKPVTQVASQLNEASQLQLTQLSETNLLLQAKITELTDRVQLAESKLAELRKEEVIAVFKEFGREVNPDVYLKLSEADFNRVMRDIKSLKPTPPAHLFKEQATGEVVTEKPVTLSATAIYANRR